jgi:hypothetical protein
LIRTLKQRHSFEPVIDAAILDYDYEHDVQCAVREEPLSSRRYAAADFFSRLGYTRPYSVDAMKPMSGTMKQMAMLL